MANIDTLRKILNNDLVAKWVNLRDYALDTLYAKSDIADIMDAADKYFYGEWGLVSQVPVMASDTVPNGTAIGTIAESSNNTYYKAFNNDKTNYFATYGVAPANRTKNPVLKYCGYVFDEPVKIEEIAFLLLRGAIDPADDYTTFSVDYSDDGETWYSLYSFDQEAIPSTNLEKTFVKIPNDDESHRYWRLSTMTGNAIGYPGNTPGYYLAINLLEFYAYGPKGNVPYMTSDLIPYGKAVASGVSSSTAAWRAFDGMLGDSHCWYHNTLPNWVGYKFTNPTCVKSFMIQQETETISYFKTYQIEYSDTGASDDWHLIESFTETVFSPGKKYYHKINNNRYHLYYRIYITSSESGSVPAVQNIQFYGREMKALVPKMTSDTDPYGAASKANGYASVLAPYPAWKAFAGTETGDGAACYPQDGLNWIAYNATKNFKVNALYAYFRKNSGEFQNCDIMIQGSNDGITWDTVDTISYVVPATAIGKLYSVINASSEYKRWRIASTTGTGKSNSSTYAYSYYISAFKIQFYGFDYTEYDWDAEHPRDYIYDHGLKFGNVERIKTKDGSIIEEEPLQIYFKPGPGESGYTDNVAIARQFNLENDNYVHASITFGNRGTPSGGSNDLNPKMAGWLSIGTAVGGSPDVRNWSSICEVLCNVGDDVKKYDLNISNVQEIAKINTGTNYFNTRTHTVSEFYVE